MLRYNNKLKIQFERDSLHLRPQFSASANGIMLE
jgi:hypothetical protein